MIKTDLIWKNGEFVPFESASVHVLTHALHYGTAVFEGVRAYQTERGPAIFRAAEHYRRLLDSAKIYLMSTDYTVEQLVDINVELLRKNNVEALINANQISSVYIRPLLYVGYGAMGLNPGNNPIDLMMAAWGWGSYLGDEGLTHGVRCKMSSWNRIDSRTLPPLAKCTANYANSILAKQEAIAAGFDEAILLNTNGYVAEGPGENIFVIKNGDILTPPPADGPLMGITADTATQIARFLGFSVTYRSLSRDELFLADEIFFTGTAAEVTPVREIDGRVIGNGSRGPITEAIQTKYFDIVQGKLPQFSSWLTFIR
ncbi:branched-chain amino acid transaminase [bacterium]|nr:branched-chain amino acid transaminase [bacterium]